MSPKTKQMSSKNEDPVSELFRNHFTQYASYVITERAIPDLKDGLKPVQRRILHSLIELDDSRFHKVANVIGNTMKYHPHGDASIGDALVVLANKNYFIDRQGNFGNLLTGDPASAPRYIECRLSALGKEVLVHKELTEMLPSYDGRNNEPVVFPCKIPYLLLHGAEGIAVGMSTRILPHNFCEALQAQIDVLQGKKFQLVPDFLQGGIMDISEYNDGEGKLKIRAKIKKRGRSLVIHDVPYGVTSEGLISSIEDAIRKNRIKAVSIKDYTTDKIEVEVNLQRGQVPEEVIKRLYAYTDCEQSISTNMILIRDGLPVKMNTTEILKWLTGHLQEILKAELQLKIAHLKEQHHRKTLEQIFIENRMYRKIENSKSYEDAKKTIVKLMVPFKKKLERAITDEDLEKLLSLPIRKITKFDIEKNQSELKEIKAAIAKEEGHLKKLKRFTIDFIRALIKKYGDQYPRRTEIQSFEAVAAKDLKDKDCRVMYDRNSGYVGTKVREGVKLDCSSFDKLLMISREGHYKVSPVQEKLFCGTLVHFGLVNKDQVFNLITRDQKSGHCYVKRFVVDKFIQNKEYPFLDPGHKFEDFTTRKGMKIQVRYMSRVKGSPIEESFQFDDFPVKAGLRRGTKMATRKVLKLTLQPGPNTEDESANGED